MNEVKLVGDASTLSAGSFVYTQQGVAKDEGFGHVSKYWYPKTKSFDEGLEQLEQDISERRDIKFDMKQLGFNLDSNGLSVQIGDEKFTPTDWAARQVCNWLDVPQTLWTRYATGKPGDLEVMKHAFENGRNQLDESKTMTFRTYQDGTLRAMMSEGYSIVDNRWYLETLQKCIPGGRLSHFEKADADNIFGNILIPDTIREEEDSDYGGMLSIGNSEIGQRSIGQCPSIFRAICMNGNIWGQAKGIEMRKRHRGLELNLLAASIAQNIQKQIPLLGEGIKKLLDTRANTTSLVMSNIFAAVAKIHKVTQPVIRETAVQWLQNSKEKSLFGVIDGLTRAGQKFDSKTWVETDELGGEIMNRGLNGWDMIQAVAKTIQPKELELMFGVAV
jgi:hypothetical protein